MGGGGGNAFRRHSGVLQAQVLLQTGAGEPRWGGQEQGAGEALREVLETEVGQELEVLRRVAAAVGEEEGGPDLEESLLKPAPVLPPDQRKQVARLAPGFAAKAGALCDAAKSHGATLRDFADRGRAVRPSVVGGAVELARGCSQFLEELADRETVPEFVVDAPVLCGAAGLAEQAAVHGLNACVWERTKRTVTEGCELSQAAERVHDLAFSLMRVFQVRRQPSPPSTSLSCPPHPPPPTPFCGYQPPHPAPFPGHKGPYPPPRS